MEKFPEVKSNRGNGVCVHSGNNAIDVTAIAAKHPIFRLYLPLTTKDLLKLLYGCTIKHLQFSYGHKKRIS